MIYPCCAEVWERGAYRPSRCSRNGTVKSGSRWYCKQHSPDAVEARRQKSEERYRAWSDAQDKALRIRQLKEKIAHAVINALQQRGPWQTVEDLGQQLIKELSDERT